MNLWYNTENDKKKPAELKETACIIIDDIKLLVSSMHEWIDSIEGIGEEEGLPQISEPTAYLRAELAELNDKWKEVVTLTLQVIRQRDTLENCVSD